MRRVNSRTMPVMHAYGRMGHRMMYRMVHHPVGVQDRRRHEPALFENFDPRERVLRTTSHHPEPPAAFIGPMRRTLDSHPN
jgi:hypothetical protein